MKVNLPQNLLHSTFTLAAFDHYFNNFQKLAHGGNQKLTMNHFQGSEFP